MVNWAVVLINAGMLVVALVVAGYNIGQMRGVQEQQNQRILRLEKRYNGERSHDESCKDR